MFQQIEESLRETFKMFLATIHFLKFFKSINKGKSFFEHSVYQQIDNNDGIVGI